MSSIKTYSDRYEHAPTILQLPQVASVISDQSASKDQVKELTRYSSNFVVKHCDRAEASDGTRIMRDAKTVM